MKRRGVLAVLLAVGLLGIADVTDQLWVLAIDSVLWAVLLVSVLVPWSSVGSVRATHQLRAAGNGQPPRPIEGDDVVLSVELRSARRWPAFGVTTTVTVSDGSTDGEFKFYFPYISPRSSPRLESVFASTRFGRHSTRGMVIGSDAPFGLFRRSKHLSKEASVLVLPRPHEVPVDSQATGEGTSERTFPMPREGEVAGARPHVVGDPSRHIHWRASARAGHIMTKSFTTPTEEGPLLVLGTGVEHQSISEEVIRVAAGVGRGGADDGDRIRLQLGHRQLETGWHGLLRELALLSDSAVPALSESLQAIQAGSTVLAVLALSDLHGLGALHGAVDQTASLRVWVLARPDEADTPDGPEVQALRRSGATVDHIEVPLTADSDSQKETASTPGSGAA